MIIRRMYSTPERITMFSAGAGMIGAIYPAIMAHTGGQGIPCPLRALTGVPCPFCGLTTATVALAHGQWVKAIQTSPLACSVAVMAVGTAPLLAARAVGWLAPPRPATDQTRKHVTWGASVVIVVNWLVQLHRYGFI